MHSAGAMGDGALSVSVVQFCNSKMQAAIFLYACCAWIHNDDDVQTAFFCSSMQLCRNEMHGPGIFVNILFCDLHLKNKLNHLEMQLHV